MPTTDELAIFRYVKEPSNYRTLADRAAHFVLSAELRTADQKLRTTNLMFEHGTPVAVQEIRCSEEKFSLDNHGFEVVTHEWALDDWTDGEAVETLYVQEVEAMLERKLGEGVRVEIYNWRLRRGLVEGSSGKSVSDGGEVKYSQPLPTVHIDQMSRGMMKRVQHCMGSEASELLKGRVRMINIWRPINNAVSDWPLAFCDGSIVSPTDLVPTNFITADYLGKMYHVMHQTEHKWYYLSQQTPVEVFLFKIADSREDMGARYCPHASFRQRGASEGATPRESIEFRALVFSAD